MRSPRLYIYHIAGSIFLKMHVAEMIVYLPACPLLCDEVYRKAMCKQVLYKKLPT